MALAKTDWKQYRATNSEIPLDIFFPVLPSKSTRDRNIEMEEEEEVDKTNMIGAHKLLLAGASPVFRANFFGPMRMVGEVMVVKETTVEAFAALIDFIYWPPGKETFSLKHITSFEKLCEIVEISERYQVLELRRMAIEALENMPITSKTVISVANAADKYKVFPDVRNILITKSLSFLNENLKSADDVFTFMMEAKKDFSDNGLELFYDLLEERERKNENVNVNHHWGTTIFSKPEEQPLKNLQVYPAGVSRRNWKIEFDFKLSNNRTANIGIYGKTYREKRIDIVFAKYLKITVETEMPEINFTSIEALKPNEWESLEIINSEDRGSSTGSTGCLDRGSSTLKVVLGGRCVLEEPYIGNIDLRDRFIKGFGNPTTYLRRLSIMTD